ncbi:MAG: hypothetical protein ACON5F_00085 [Jejuia sp.]
MKTIRFIALLFSCLCFSQQGINYKAVIQDGEDIVANTSIVIYFTIKENGTTDVYKETQVLTTNKSGIISTVIGLGTPTLGNFDTIDWTQEQFLNVAINIGNGIEDLGTTLFHYVPYALHAKTAEVFTGTLPKAGSLHKVTENGNDGYRLIDAAINNHGDIGEEAIDLSFQSSASDIRGATAAGAFASGYNTEASGEYSVAFGYGTKASDTYATSFGLETEALGYTSLAFGRKTTALGYISTVFGEATTAESYAQTTMGMYNTEVVPNQVSSFDYDDRLFVIGNGVNSALRSDALVMLKNGNTELNGALTIDASNNNTGYTLPISKGTAGQVLTVGADDSETSWSFVSGSGHLERITEDGNTGYRLLGINVDNYGNIGNNALDLSYNDVGGNDTYGATGEFSIAAGRNTFASGVNATALGYASWATGDYSLALGYESEAIGRNAIAMGYDTEASGEDSFSAGYKTLASGKRSVAFGDTNRSVGNNSATFGSDNRTFGVNALALGNNCVADGSGSIAMGQSAEAYGDVSFAMGYGTTTESYGQLSLGIFNTIRQGSENNIVPTDRLFVIGNGTGRFSPSDAMVVLKNGNTTINGEVKVEELQATDSGDADMKAYIYGLVTDSGSIATASSDGFTVTKTGTGAYRIVFNSPPSSYTNYMVVSTLHGDIGFIKTFRNTTYIAVNTYNVSGTLSDEAFNFVVYKK